MDVSADNTETPPTTGEPSDRKLNANYSQQGNTWLVCDETLAAQINPNAFDPDYWQTYGAMVGEGEGRGSAWFVRADDSEWVLRHYRRGGAIGKVNHDRYLWTGLEQTRPWAEWHLLSDLYQRRLPVPRPVAARVTRHGLYYTADIITARFARAKSLAQTLSEIAAEPATLRAVGACVGRFHRAGVCHADLNAHNILIGETRTGATPEIALIDFDRGRFRDPDKKWQTQNLHRLRRSLCKLADQRRQFFFDELAWGHILTGYGNTS